jgi:hypothetical protein
VGATVASEMSVKTENSGVKIRSDAFVFARQIPGELRLRRTRKVRKQRAKDSYRIDDFMTVPRSRLR